MNLKKLLKVGDNSSAYYTLLEYNFMKFIVRIDGRTNDHDSDYTFDNGTGFKLGEDYKYYECTPVYVSYNKNGVWSEWEEATREVYKKHDPFRSSRGYSKEIIRVHGNLFSDFDDVTTDINYLLRC